MKYTNTILSSSIGNILEWYDFGLFTIFSPLFSRLFFPSKDPATALIATFGIFAVGFLCRPIGALFFGYLGDKKGRALTLRVSILLIALPTLFIGFLPTYADVGLLAPVLLMMVRILQGISVGGEYSGNIVYLAEMAPKNYRATFTALASMGSNIGILLAAMVGILCSAVFEPVTLEQWGWRVPYIVSGIICLLIYYFRLRLRETYVYNFLQKKHSTAKNPIKFMFKYDMNYLVKTFCLVCMGSTFYYFCFVYLPIYLRERLHYSLQDISILMSSLILSMIVLVPLFGMLCDRLGRKKMLVANASLITLLVIPGFVLMQFNSLVLLVGVMLIFTMLSASEQGTTPITLVENFPAPARYTGVSFGYNLGNGFLGGTVPMVCEWLLTRTNVAIAPAIYIGFCAFITWVVCVFFIKETFGKSLLR